MSLLDSANKRLGIFAAAIVSLSAIGVFISDAGQAVDEAVMSHAEHDTDPRFNQANAKLDMLIKQSLSTRARIAADSIKTILRDSCERTSGLSERGLEIIEGEQAHYEAYYDRRMGCRVHADGTPYYNGVLNYLKDMRGAAIVSAYASMAIYGVNAAVKFLFKAGEWSCRKQEAGFRRKCVMQ